MMRNLVLVWAAAVTVAAVTVVAGTGVAAAQDIPTLTQFKTDCYRNSGMCRVKIEDYINAASGQHFICLPDGKSARRVVGDVLDWIRDENNMKNGLADGPYDDGLFEATKVLFPCAPSAPVVPPVPPPSGEAPPPPPADASAPSPPQN